MRDNAKKLRFTQSFSNERVLYIAGQEYVVPDPEEYLRLNIAVEVETPNTPQPLQTEAKPKSKRFTQ